MDADLPYDPIGMIQEDHHFVDEMFIDTSNLYAINVERRDGEPRVRQAAVEHPSLVLYCRSTCPYCQRVMRYLRSINKEKAIPIKDIGKSKKARSELAEIGGKVQVPCLVINGKALFESSDIIDWLKANQDKY